MSNLASRRTDHPRGGKSRSSLVEEGMFVHVLALHRGKNNKTHKHHSWGRRGGSSEISCRQLQTVTVETSLFWFCAVSVVFLVIIQFDRCLPSVRVHRVRVVFAAFRLGCWFHEVIQDPLFFGLWSIEEPYAWNLGSRSKRRLEVDDICGRTSKIVETRFSRRTSSFDMYVHDATFLSLSPFFFNFYTNLSRTLLLISNWGTIRITRVAPHTVPETYSLSLFDHFSFFFSRSLTTKISFPFLISFSI